MYAPHCRAYLRFRYFHRMLEENRFKAELKEQSFSDRPIDVEGSLVLKEKPGDGLMLGLRWTPADGQPKRYPRPEVIHLSRGQWAQLTMNGRHSSYSGQFYSEDIYNVAYGESIAPDVFFARIPDHRFSLADNLF
jgi:hypothetical protein